MNAVSSSAKKAASSAPLAHGVGRRKSSVARVWLRRGTGSIVVNGKTYDAYFDTEMTRLVVAAAFGLAGELRQRYDLLVNVQGGGRTGQADATKLGIARALVEANPELRPTLREHGLLTVDSRIKERKKYGQRGARRKFQFVKR
jgi:small subunit ribosomal protein S9